MKAKLICVCALAIGLFAIRPKNAIAQLQESQTQHAARIAALEKEYNSFSRKDWKKRRDFCIRLIDEHVISDGTRVSDIRRIFRRDLFERGKTETLPAGGFVRFERPLNERSDVQNRIGWHFTFDATDNGYVDKYYLTDFNK